MKRITESMYDKIPELIEQGHSAAEIAVKYNVTKGSLAVLCSKRGISLQKGGNCRGPAILRLDYSALDNLRWAAKRRGMDVEQLAISLLNVIVADNLYNAVLGE